MQCLIISSETKQSLTDIKSITLPAITGELQILPGHAESFIGLTQGEIILQTETITRILIKKGICHIKSDLARIIL